MLLYKVHPPKKDLLFYPSTFYRNANFKSSSNNSKEGFLKDNLLYVGDIDEINIHLFPKCRRLRVVVNNNNIGFLHNIGVFPEKDIKAVIWCNAIKEEILEFKATVYKFDSKHFEKTESNEYISRIPVAAIGFEEYDMQTIISNWKLNVLFTSNNEIDSILFQLKNSNIPYSEQT